jgi:iron complex outermembrane recepter protein
VTLQNIIGYRRVKSDVEFDFDATPAVLFESRNRLDSKQFTEELQLSGDATDRLNYIGGIFFRESGRDTQDSVLFGTRSNDGFGINKSYSAYAQLGYKLTDQLNLTADGRSRGTTVPSMRLINSTACAA